MAWSDYPFSDGYKWINDDKDSEFFVEVAMGNSDALNGGGPFDESAWGTAKWETNSPEDAYWQGGLFDWYDIGAYVKSLKSSRGRQSFNETFPAGTMTVRLQNHLGEWARSGVIANTEDIAVGMPIRWGLTADVQWSGYIAEIREIYDHVGNAVVDLLCEDGLARLAAFTFPDVPTLLWPYGADPQDAMDAVWSAAGWPSGTEYRVFAGSYLHTLERLDIAGLNALDAAREIAEAEGGAVFVNSDGALQFQNRDWLTSTAGDTPDYDIESDGTGDQDLRRLDPVVRTNRRIINAATYFRKSRPDTQSSSAYDDESIQSFGRREVNRELITATVGQLGTLVNRLIQYRAWPQRELPSVAVRPLSNGNTFLAERGLELGDIASITYRHPTESWNWTIDNHIVGIRDDIDEIGTWTRTLFLDSTYTAQAEVGG